MKLITQLREQLESIGATLDDRAEQFLVCDAPSGYVWWANRETSLVIHWKNNGGQSWLAQALLDELPRLRMGLTKVIDQEEIASIQYALDDDFWGAPADAPKRIEWPAA